MGLSAQVIPDSTLGAESSTIRSIDDLRDAIEGGAIRGENLFHSFSEFRINEGTRVDFANPEGITNIFSRVTGSNVSEIFGTLGVDGMANLFLFNPNGIVFGENAAIDIGGSLMATTAESIEFNSGEKFSAVAPSEPLLTIDFPIGLGMGSIPGNIEVRGEQNNVSLEIPSFRVIAEDLPSSIEVDTGENISLIGGELNFDGGGLQAPGGNVELASMDADQTLKLIQNNGWFLVAPDSSSTLKDISLNNAAYIDVSSERGGNIHISGRNISLNEGSVVLANTSSASNNTIEINATELLEIKGTSGEFQADFTFQEIENPGGLSMTRDEVQNNYSVSLIGADVFSDSNGNGNDINISAKSLQIFDGGQIRTVNFSQHKSFAGDIDIDADNILLEGTNNIDSLSTSVINSSNGSGSVGNAGNVNINTQTIKLKDGGRITTDAFGTGSGGNLTIESKDILLEGFVQPFVPIFTGLFASSRAEDNTGNITIKTETLNILDGALINASTFGKGSAGNIKIESESVNVSGLID
ncbi:MAG: filamentous hemagglutinin N-terminal domain-containing protein [Pleurocapsa sp. MO_226.B13]|nr:filamentous hemagglutinin N-terminal domain-containing protein [Pleurocapsa sp. MO_226.B13]